MHEKFGCILVIGGRRRGVGAGSQGIAEAAARSTSGAGASGGPAARRALDCLAEALGKIRIDLRKPNVATGKAELPPIRLDDSAPFDRLSVVDPADPPRTTKAPSTRS